MSISTNTVRREVVGRARLRTVEVTFDSSYPTGGEVLDLAAIGLNKADFVSIAPAAGYVFEYDYANNKIKAFRSGALSGHTHTFTGTTVTPTFTGTELAAVPGTPAGAVSEVTAAGTNTAAGSHSAAALAEVANATDLSAVVTRAFVVGV